MKISATKWKGLNVEGKKHIKTKIVLVQKVFEQVKSWLFGLWERQWCNVKIVLNSLVELWDTHYNKDARNLTEIINETRCCMWTNK
jgi:hypothetical protein